MQAPADPDPALRPAPAGLTGDQVMARVLERNKRQDAELRRYLEVRTYEIRNTEGKVGAEEVVQVAFHSPDEKTFDTVSQHGSWVIRHLVFDRLISAEKETDSGREHHDSSISTANYKFTLLGKQDLGSRDCFVLQATPRTRNKYLFKGKIWVDSRDFAIVRIAGQPAQKLSFWIHRIDFVREYRRIGGFWLPAQDTTCVDVRIYGKRVFTIGHQQLAVNGAIPSPLPQQSSARASACGVVRGANAGVEEAQTNGRK